MFELDLRSRDPIYQQLVDKFKALIIKKVLQTDEKLPSVRTLAQQMTINPNTIQKAYRELESLGFIYSIKGKGSFVAPMVEEENGEAIRTIKASLSQLIQEALFLGVTKQDIIELIERANHHLHSKEGE
ncbi:GntR family transcriptional regulator [Amphibacillus marinus]|uniref:GntR family transcriptional regulator n=1 Tax=Amphibacillus marinus TaxID=872970 RepID=A0A1H8IF20_9BACI|nr:GntR family transcriptional regulator [Amphibacillus marinus]SEN66911.1 GntR family transcriptional regulator [Amphibacillus marinus]